MPPIIAILLALLTKEVYLSLFAGCALGALLWQSFTPGSRLTHCSTR